MNEVPPPRVGSDSISVHGPPQERAVRDIAYKPREPCLTPGQSRSGPPPATDFSPPSPPPPPPPPPPLSREWIPRQPEFMSNLPPPSTRLPGAPPPPVLPTQPYVA